MELERGEPISPTEAVLPRWVPRGGMAMDMGMPPISTPSCLTSWRPTASCLTTKKPPPLMESPSVSQMSSISFIAIDGSFGGRSASICRSRRWTS